MKKQLKYKFLRESLKSNSGNLTWKIGEWQKVTEKLDICNVGLHCSSRPYQAFSYVQGEILAIVETKGKSIIQDDKECWSEMRIIRAYKWTKNDSIELAIFAAEKVIDVYEKYNSIDDRPRKAIEAAKEYIKNPTEENRLKCAGAAWAAEAAGAAWAAWAAEAAGAAWAAEAAEAAWAAAWAAEAAGAAWAAEAAGAAIREGISQWFDKRVKTLEEYK